MDSGENVHVGVVLKHPAVGSLSLRERARVRASDPLRAGNQKDTAAGCDKRSTDKSPVIRL